MISVSVVVVGIITTVFGMLQLLTKVETVNIQLTGRHTHRLRDLVTQLWNVDLTSMSISE